jgi:hypothetical protein
MGGYTAIEKSITPNDLSKTIALTLHLQPDGGIYYLEITNGTEIIQQTGPIRYLEMSFATQTPKTDTPLSDIWDSIPQPLKKPLVMAFKLLPPD